MPPLPGALDAVDRMRDAGLAVGFLTNTTSRPNHAVLARLRLTGLAVEAHDVVAPAEAARAWLERHDRTPC